MPIGRGLQRISRKGEEKTARDLGGKRQPASGSQPFRKGDVRTDRLLVERKDTHSGSYSLKVADLQKLRQQAAKEDTRLPVFQVVYREAGESYAVISWLMFVELMNTYQEVMGDGTR